MTKVKICGVTNLEDALHACSLQADAIGFVFVRESPRYIDPIVAGKIIRELSPFVTSVGLFVNEKANVIQSIIDKVSLDVLQFHGDEAEEFCQRFNKKYIKAIQVKDSVNLIEYCDKYNSASAILLDTYSETSRGGTGELFDWKLIPPNSPKPLIIAGGLNSKNVKQLLDFHNPYAVDVSGGVEQHKGKKDSHKMKEFILGVKNASL